MRRRCASVVAATTVVSASCGATVSGPATATPNYGALTVASRNSHLPGWKQKQSTKDQRTREQREVDRKARQIEKLPKPEALHDFQYPHEKTVLADHLFQPTVFETELDTPHLFHIASPADFFIYWNCADSERTDYPAVPTTDHRRFIPDSESETWVDHRAKAAQYLAKHEVCPQLLPFVAHEANLSVVFSGLFGPKARRDPETGEALPPPPPVSALEAKNFWFTSHLGNFIELCELQEAPSIFFTTPKGSEDSFYTLVIASPDFPYRTHPNNRLDSNHAQGFFVNTVVSNLRGGQTLEAKKGDVIVPYVPPLPTEDAGTTRHICMLFKQFHRVPVEAAPAGESLSFQQRSNFRLHEERKGFSLLKDVERSLPADPVAATFFQTKWDIQVQEFYESINEPEPALQLDEELGAILRYNSLTSADLRVRARHQPDGATNMGMVQRQLVQTQPTLIQHGSMNKLWSRRTHLGTNNVPIVTPH